MIGSIKMISGHTLPNELVCFVSPKLINDERVLQRIFNKCAIIIHLLLHGEVNYFVEG